MNALTGTKNPGKDIVIEFGCGSTPFSIDRKLSVKVDTGSDTNAINKQTIQELFPNVELEESTSVLQNFNKRPIKPIGSFRCFLRWKGNKLWVWILQAILANNSVSFSDPTPGHSKHSVPSMKGVFCHLAPPMEENLCHSVKS